MIRGDDITRIRLGLASPEEIRSWSHGEVTESETINYRTHKPERGGLYAEEIFGPEKDYECACGKYRGRKYEGIRCEKCNVLVTTREVRRTNMGHIELASPVVHFWYLKGLSNPLSTLLGIKRNVLKKIVYYETEPVRDEIVVVTAAENGSPASGDWLYKTQAEILSKKREFTTEPAYELSEAFEVRARKGGTVSFDELTLDNGQKMRVIRVDGEDHPVTPGAILEVKPDAGVEDDEILAVSPIGPDELVSETQVEFLKSVYEDIQFQKIEETVDNLIFLVTQVDDPELPFDVGDLLLETELRAYQAIYPKGFKAAAGADGIEGVLANLELDSWAQDLRDRINNETSIGRQKRLLKRLEVVDQLRKSGNRPQDMVLKVVPVMPPELRPIVQLEGGKFATTDLNDLYRRIINRNNRLGKLREMGAPEIILRNEKRMLQEAVDALIHNEKKENQILGRDNRPLKSLSERVQGKHGRLRRNLLGKRVDYSGRAVIVVNPKLKLHQCGIPKKMALELFKPFILRELSRLEVPNISNYDEVKNKALSGDLPQVWDILDQLVTHQPVLLNRAPTLHRLGIQAFEPVLVDGEAIQIHPFVCPPYNADFDGDQMAVHLPLAPEAIRETRERMLASKNVLSPANGSPLTVPTKDFVFAFYYYTMDDPEGIGAGKAFSSIREAERAYETGVLALHAPIKIRLYGQIVDTTLGRAKFNELLPEDLRDYEKAFDSSAIEDVFMECYRRHGNDRTVELLDDLKDLALATMTRSGLTISVTDALIPPDKGDILDEARERVGRLEQMYARGLATAEERRQTSIQVWMQTVDRMEKATMENLSKYRFNPVRMVVESGARGSANQVKQLAGMRGPMSDPAGRIIERPVISNFREGLSVTEYFISTHGGRKGTADTALKTAESGYLTRRLVDVAEELVIKEHDCGTQAGIELHPLRYSREEIMESLEERLYGRVAAEPIRWAGETLLEAGAMVDVEQARQLGRLTRELNVDDNGFVENVVGTVSVHDVRDPETGTVIVGQDERVTDYLAERLRESNVEQVTIRPRFMMRSVMTCETRRGVCQQCYGLDLARHQEVPMGMAVGVIAAQSIGEPGTQLTMRTFHTGGVVGEDITQGLPRAEELFEARKSIKSPEGQVAMISGVVTNVHRTESGYEQVDITGDEKRIRVPTRLSRAKTGAEMDATSIISTRSPASGVIYTVEHQGRRTLYLLDEDDRVYALPPDVEPAVETGDWVETGDALSEAYNEEPAVAQRDGTVTDFIEDGDRFIVVEDDEGQTYQYKLPYGARKQVEIGDKVTQGMPLSTRSTPFSIKADAAGMAVVGDGMVIVYTPDPDGKKTFSLTEDIAVTRDEGTRVNDGQELFGLTIPLHGSCRIDDVAEIEDGLSEVRLHYEMSVPLDNAVRTEDGRDTYLPAAVRVGDKIQEGDLLSKGVTSPHLLLKVAGVNKTRDYLLTEIHKVYKSQGVDINDKHIELIIRQMLNNVRITDPGDSEFFPNQLVILEEFRAELRRLGEENRAIQRERETLVGSVLLEDLVTWGGERIAEQGAELGRQTLQTAVDAGIERVTLDRGQGAETVRVKEKRMPVGERVLLRISKAALETKSWLSAASFQRTTTILSEAAMQGKVDHLEGLKPNVIIGRLIPAGTGYGIDPSAPKKKAEDGAEDGAVDGADVPGADGESPAPEAKAEVDAETVEGHA